MNVSLNNSDRPIEIMIVDDETTSLLLLEMMLTKAGYSTRKFSSGDLAYSSSCLKQPDLIILDIQMPIVDGYEICRRLKENSATRDIPVIFISALDSGNDIAKGFVVGGADYIVKPFKREEVLFRIKNQIELTSNRKKLNQQITSQLRFQHDLLNTIPNPIYFKDTNERYLGCNTGFEICFGIKREQIIGKTDLEFFQESKFPLILEYSRICSEKELELLKSDSSFQNIEAKIKFADGLLHDTITSKTVFFDQEINQYYVIYVITDITGLLVLEEKLRHSQKMEAIGVLAAGIAHEINSPMQYILDNTRFIEDNLKKLIKLLDVFKQSNFRYELTDYEKINELINTMDLDYMYNEIPLAINENIAGIAKIKNIVSALKDFSFPRNFVISDTDINKSLDSILIITASSWKHNATMEKAFAEELPLIPCYIDELNQVYINLIVNAVDAIKEKNDRNGVLKISTSLAGDYLQISFSDNGIGIPESIKNKIFEPFFTTKEVGKGTGQGLSIVYDIVCNLHKGTIEVNSEFGKGTEFLIKLPIIQGEKNAKV